jgi:hypothetical protein
MRSDPLQKADHEKRVTALREANVATAKVQQMPPTPTQEENDLMALGLMNIDDKESGQTKEPARAAPAPRAATTPEPHTTRQT